MGPRRGFPVIAYLDSSVVLARVFDEEPRPSVHAESVLTSELTIVEVARRLIHRGFTDDPWTDATEALATIELLAVGPEVIARASTLPVRHLKSLDALHVASALLVGADIVITGDRQMARACAELGLAVA